MKQSSRSSNSVNTYSSSKLAPIIGIQDWFYFVVCILISSICSSSIHVVTSFTDGHRPQSRNAMKAVSWMHPFHSQRRIKFAPCNVGYTTRRNTKLFVTNNDKSSRHGTNISNDSMLQQMLEELANLNGGQTVNPRSAKQVSDLLYRGHNGSSGGTRPAGATDKNTLLSIIHRADNHGLINSEVEKQKRIAQLVLSCREYMAFSSSSLGVNSMSAGSSIGLFSNKSLLEKRIDDNISLQTASFSNFAFTGSNHTVGIGENDNSFSGSNRIVDNFESSDYDDTLTSKDLPSSPSSVMSSSISPYDRMVRTLFSNVNFDDDDPTATANTNYSTAGSNPTSSLDPYWMEPLLSLTKSSSRSLVRQLRTSASCPMGYDPSATPFSHLSSLNATSSTNIKITKKESLLSFVRSQKAAHFSDSILLVRVGDFYESYGVDAVMLVEHAGLNPMAGKARAGCPWKNVQATLDALTNAGFRVAVYEEWNGEEDGEVIVSSEEEDEIGGSGGKGSRLKTRYLAQVVSSANPTYMHGLVLNDNDGSASDDYSTLAGGSEDGLTSSALGRSYVGVIETHAGYTLVEISAEERTAVVSERLTAEAVSCRLVAYPPADPLLYVPPATDDYLAGRRTRLDRLPFLPWRQQHRNQHSSMLLSPSSRVRVKTLPPSLVVEPAPGLSELERAKQTVVSAFLRLEDDSIAKSMNDELNGALPPKRRERRRVTHEDFVLINPSSGESSPINNDSGLHGDVTTTRATPLPLHLETATQLGLMGDSSIPSLISSLLPESAPASCRKFLRRFLLVRPPPDVADAMSQLVRVLKEEDHALPPLNAPSLTGKVISLIRAGQASAAVYRNVLCALDAAIQLLDKGDRAEGGGFAGVIAPLMRVLHHDTGIEVVDSISLKERFFLAKQTIEEVVDTHNMESTLWNIDVDGNHEEISFFGDVVPYAFFERNEITWRGRVKQNALEHSHAVPHAAMRLVEAVATDFWGVDLVEYTDRGEVDLSSSKETRSPIVQDIFNNIFAIKAIPSWAKESRGGLEAKYYHPRDRNGKLLRNRYSTERVEQSISDYVDACDVAKKEVTAALTRLSYQLVDKNHLPAIFQASHLNLIVSTAANHAANSNSKGWNIGTIYDESNVVDSAGILNGLWPYWMDRSNSVSNTFELNGIFLLTAPNMSGKSTVMRSTAAAALLISSGLCAPVMKGSSIRRFDAIFVRGASADIPTENKSAFGAEMGDVASLLRTCSSRSLVFVDEIGRGTSPKDGTSLAGAILERMAEAGMSGMFATHLHGILNFPLSDAAKHRIKKKRMAIDEDGGGQLRWTYTMEDGICTNSLALLTAAKFGLPESIIARAEELSKYWEVNKAPEITSARIYSTAPKADIIEILENAAGEVGGKSAVFIPPSYMPPPSLEGGSCVYILQLGLASNQMRYYVGETDSLARRLMQHRLRGNEWASSSAVAIQVEGGKSSARSLESIVIQRLAKLGFDLVTVTDGTSIRSRRAT